jgi:hypothetical protein
LICSNQTGESLVITDKLLYNRKAKFEAERLGAILMGDEQTELLKLRKENKQQWILTQDELLVGKLLNG